MGDTRRLLTEALRERLSIIGDETSRRDPESHMERLRIVSEKIEALRAALPASTEPRLRHFLERRSYDKALAVLEGGPVE
jgi:hypothetical protein